MSHDLVLPSTLAKWDPLGGTPEPHMTGHDGVCVHTMAGTFAGTDAYFHQNGWSGTESTVGIAGSGYCKQWVPWNRQADANLQGNARWLSIECADGGENFPPLSTANDESPPLTDKQLERIIDLCVFWCDVRSHVHCPSSWTCHQKGIPPRWIANSCERGIGVHRHGIDPWRDTNCPAWSSSGGKICPRSIRLRQVRDIVVPAVARRLSTTPEPTPIPPEEDYEMVMVRRSDGAVLLLHAGKLVQVETTTDLRALADAGVKTWRVGDKQWSTLASAFPLVTQ